MNDTAIINGILNQMKLETDHKFYDLWFRAINGVHDFWQKREFYAVPILKRMEKDKLIRIVNVENLSYGGVEYHVKLTEKGYLIKESGGVQIKQRSISDWVWIWIGRLATMATIVTLLYFLLDRYKGSDEKPESSEDSTQVQSKQFPILTPTQSGKEKDSIISEEADSIK